MQNMEPKMLAQDIVEDIVDDLTGRKGLKHAWWDIDVAIRDSIVARWEEIVTRNLTGDPRK